MFYYKSPKYAIIPFIYHSIFCFIYTLYQKEIPYILFLIQWVYLLTSCYIFSIRGIPINYRYKFRYLFYIFILFRFTIISLEISTFVLIPNVFILLEKIARYCYILCDISINRNILWYLYLIPTNNLQIYGMEDIEICNICNTSLFSENQIIQIKECDHYVHENCFLISCPFCDQIL